MQRDRSLIGSLEFSSSFPYRSFPMPVQFGHLSAHRTRKQSFNQGQRFSWLKGSWAAVVVGHLEIGSTRSGPLCIAPSYE